MDLNFTETILERGWRDTKRAVVSFGFWAVQLVGTTVIGVRYENPIAMFAFLWTVAVVVWVCATVSAPIRQRNDLRAYGLNLEDKIKDFEANVPRLSGSVENIVTAPGGALIVPFVTINNLGPMPTVYDVLSARVYFDGEEIDVQFVYHQDLRLGDHYGGGLTITWDKSLFEKQDAVISQGMRVRGHLSLVPKSEIKAIGETISCEIDIRDVTGQIYTIKGSSKSRSKSAGPIVGTEFHPPDNDNGVPVHGPKITGQEVPEGSDVVYSVADYQVDLEDPGSTVETSKDKPVAGD